MTYRELITLADKLGTYLAEKFKEAAYEAMEERGHDLDDLAL